MGEFVGRSAAEVYAELGGRDRAPVCRCHGRPQVWERRTSRAAGGVWRCAVQASRAAVEHRRRRAELEQRGQLECRAELEQLVRGSSWWRRLWRRLRN